MWSHSYETKPVTSTSISAKKNPEVFLKPTQTSIKELFYSKNPHRRCLIVFKCASKTPIRTIVYKVIALGILLGSTVNGILCILL